MRVWYRFSVDIAHYLGLPSLGPPSTYTPRIIGGCHKDAAYASFMVVAAVPGCSFTGIINGHPVQGGKLRWVSTLIKSSVV